jgi:small neutral amino acid transporter SnatA (MarC family)
LARKCFPFVRWAIFGIYFVDLSTTLMRYYGGPELSVSIHAYSIWAGVYLVAYSLAILTGPPKQRRRKKLLQRHGQRRWAGQLALIPA